VATPPSSQPSALWIDEARYFFRLMAGCDQPFRAEGLLGAQILAHPLEYSCVLPIAADPLPRRAIVPDDPMAVAYRVLGSERIACSHRHGTTTVVFTFERRVAGDDWRPDFEHTWRLMRNALVGGDGTFGWADVFTLEPINDATLDWHERSAVFSIAALADVCELLDAYNEAMH
jgi:hypothetical protein